MKYMGVFSQQLNIANFTCTFGTELVLLDLVNEVVLPAFFESGRRSYGNTSYFLHDVQLINLENDTAADLAVTGRFIKETSVSRTQVFENDKIVKDAAQLSSAPSSFFVLLLSNHKLLYVRETSGAPSIATFESTMTQFLRRKHVDFVNAVYEYQASIEKKITKRALYERYPLPTVEVVPLATESSISAFVEKFRTINAVEIQLLQTNHELDNSKLFGKLRDIKSDIRADKLSIRTEKSGEVGLEKGRVESLITGPALDGNSKIKIRGLDLSGEKLNAENESFRISVPVPRLSDNVKDAALSLVAVLARQVISGLIKLQKPNAAGAEKLAALISYIENK